MSVTKIVVTTVRGYPLRFLVGLPTFLRERGMELHIISSPDEEFRRFCDREGCEGHPVRTSRTITPIRDIISVIRIWRTIRRVRPAVVESHMSKAGVVGMMAAWAARVPIRIYTNHGVAFSSSIGWRRRLLRLVERISCRLASRVHTMSHSVRELMIREGCCRPEKIHVLANGSTGIDVMSRFNSERVPPDVRSRTRLSCNIPSDAMVLGFVGRIAALKGVDDLAAVWQVLRQEYSNLHLLMVGGVDSRSAILPQTDAAFRADPRVHFTNEVGDTVPYYSAMDVQVLPSVHEGLPTVLLEGSAMELPVVASSIPGNVDAVDDGVTGTLVPVHDLEALTRAIRTYLDDPVLRREHGRAGRSRMLRYFQREIVWKAWHEEYLHLLQEKGYPLPEASHDSQTVCDTPHRRAA